MGGEHLVLSSWGFQVFGTTALGPSDSKLRQQAPTASSQLPATRQDKDRNIGMVEKLLDSTRRMGGVRAVAVGSLFIFGGGVKDLRLRRRARWFSGCRSHITCATCLRALYTSDDACA